MMSRENVSITKIWAPTLGETQEKVEEIDRTDRIVIQALTRNLDKTSMEELTSLTFETVEKCLTKAEKVIISLIVDREDDYSTRAKAEAVNANIKLKYINNPNVFVCHHDNLRERRFKARDLLHLTSYGTSRLANNLKYKIAESLDIQIMKKRRDGDNRYDRNNERQQSYNTRDNSWNNNANNKRGNFTNRETYNDRNHNEYFQNNGLGYRFI